MKEKDLLGIMSFLILFLLIFGISGCNTPFIPVPEPDPIRVTIPANTDYKTIMYWEIAKICDVPLPGPKPKPNPDPKPEPKPDGVSIGDDCPAPCEGGWTFGDGTHKQVCWKCNGDGRVDEGDPILTGESTQTPTLAPLPEIQMIAPIEIIVAKAMEKTIYSIEKDGLICIWDADKNVFVCPDGEEIEVEGVSDISATEEITINYGEYFRRFPVLKKTIVENSDDFLERAKEPENGGSRQ
jgi:hypothetical protein